MQCWVDQQVANLSSDYQPPLTEDEHEAMVKSFHQRLSVPLTRSWTRAGNYYMKYICESPEQPLGPIKAYWYRWEDNDDSGALQHLHALLHTVLNKDNPNDLCCIQSKIVCSSRKAIDPIILEPLF